MNERLIISCLPEDNTLNRETDAEKITSNELSRSFQFGQEKGPFYEDFKKGDKIVHNRGRTITEIDNIWFSLLTCNTNEIHFNKDYAERNFAQPPFNGRLVVNSALTFSIILGLSSEETSKNGIMLGLTNLKVTNPTFAGDTLYAESEVIEIRESASHPTMGLVTVRTRGFNQGKIQIIEFDRIFMVRKAGKQWK
jgi:itaconyl-CoA hydratase